MDSMIPLTQMKSGATMIQAERDPWEIQSFLHAVVPSLDSAGLEGAGNIGGTDISTDPCDVYLNPRWTPTAPYNTSSYTANQWSNTPNIAFQEWGFIRPVTGVRYDQTYWLSCLQDMDTVKSWNTNADGSLVPASQRMYYAVQVPGTDAPGDPTSGVNGWMQYGLASYLLGQNEFTYFTWANYTLSSGNIDYSSTANLGSASGNRTSIGGDPYFLYRNYNTTSGGTVVVVVNANNTARRTYILSNEVTDETGSLIPGGTVITLLPHTGRIFTYAANSIVVNVSAPTIVSPGQTVPIVVSYSNVSSSDVSNVQVTAGVPSQMTYMPGSAEATGGVYNSTANSVTWLLPLVKANSQGTKTFNATVK